jgi:putative methanogenesis marker protein 7
MRMYKMYVFKGGVYRHDEILDKIHDLGGIVMQKTPMQTEIDIIFALPGHDLSTLTDLAQKLKGDINEIPFGDMEIAVVAPSLSRHHLPHPVCDIAEFLRRYGATTNIVGLARGYGKTIFQISDKEKRMIAEHDAAIFSFGAFENCIMEKVKETSAIKVPHIVCGGPRTIQTTENYVGNVGRKSARMRSVEDIASLEEIKRKLMDETEALREELQKDPPLYAPAYVKKKIEKQLDIAGTLGDNPVVLHLDGVRVKKSYETFSERVSNVQIGDVRLGDISTISKSDMNDTIIVRLLPESQLGDDAQ